MSQHDFDELLQKYLAGACDPAEEKLILNWYHDINSQQAEAVDTRTQEVMRQRIWQKLAANTTGKDKSHRLKRGYAYAAMAALGLFITVGVWYYTRPSSVVNEVASPGIVYPGSLELKNTSPNPQLVKMEDGSLITLKAGSTVSYPAHFGQHSRTVFLRGNASFNVKRDPGRPFIVHTGELITEVLGTSFTISSDAKAIEVAVTTGRVSVYRAVDSSYRHSKEVILKPNERITYRMPSKQLIPSLVTHPIRVVPPSQSVNLQFDGTPLPDVLASIQAVYGIDIFLESDALSACVLNADLNDLPLYNQLDLVCRSVDALYEVRGTSIFIKTTGPGCQ